jgi:hypothetical protein
MLLPSGETTFTGHEGHGEGRAWPCTPGRPPRLALCDGPVSGLTAVRIAFPPDVRQWLQVSPA